MKLATRKNQTRDGELLVVSKDNQTAVVAGAVAPTLQSVMDDWAAKAPQLEAMYAALNAGEQAGAFAVNADELLSPARGYPFGGHRLGL